MNILEKIDKILYEGISNIKNISDLIEYIDNNISKMPDIKKYYGKSRKSEEDFVIQDCPISLLIKYGFTREILNKIEKNTKNYEGTLDISSEGLVDIYDSAY